MPRVGRNPMKSAGKPYIPRSVTLITAVHIPELAGYWEESLDVLRVCLESVLQHTTAPYDLMVFDNGSCPPVREYLQQLHDDGALSFLVLSRENVGKVGCWNMTFPAAPGEYIAWFDSDVLFRSGWLEQSLRVFDAFDNVGMVTARPGRLPVAITDDIISATLDYARRGGSAVEYATGDLIPREIIADHFRSIGVDENTSGYPELDHRLSRNGVSVYAFASHFQFVARRDVAVKLLPLHPGDHPLGADRAWDVEMNRQGYFRLSLDKAYVRHLGNKLNGEDLHALENRAATRVARAGRAEPPANWFSRGYARRVLMRVYEAIGKLLFPT